MIEKRLFLAGILSLLSIHLLAQPDLTYYLPEGITYDSNVPTPKTVLGFEVGEFHVSHDQLVTYMKAVDAASDRVSLEVMGQTHERRPLILLTITSPKNHDRIESIRMQHLELCNPAKSASLDIAPMAVVFYLGCSIHGNEASGNNAALLIAYYLAAARGEEIETALDNTIVLLDPSFNPDGMQRFSSWVNSRRSMAISADPNDMEHHEPWPGGRTNHYWFDLNRDWLVAQQPESQARIRKFHQWKPNVLTDHHEMGSNYTFFFQPGVPSRTNPLTPQKNIELTKQMAQYHAKALDAIGSFYFTQEGYDDFYYGKGSTFPDVQGSIGILFEQASSRGHAQESANGILRFPFAIRNQFTAALSSLQAVNVMRLDLLGYQRQFFKDAVSEASKDPVKAIVFGCKDRMRAYMLAQIVAQHEISVHELPATATYNGKSFEAGAAYVVPLQQPQYRLIKAMFEKRTTFRDSIFYDISSWTLPLAAGVEYEEVRSASSFGKKVDSDSAPKGRLVGTASQYAYAFDPIAYFAPRAMFRLLEKGIAVKVATEPFSHPTGKKFPVGSILVPVSGQERSAELIEFVIKEIVERDGLDVYAFETGLNFEGVSLGSGSFRNVRMPEIAVLVGDGISANDAGEIWHLLDTRYEMPVTMMPLDVFSDVDLKRYNTLIFPPGNYRSVSERTREKLKAWIQDGGVAIGLENAVNWFAGTSLARFELKKGDDPAIDPRPYGDLANDRAAQQTDGAIFEATVDLTHPLLYGYYRDKIAIFKGNNIFMEKSRNAYGNPVVMTAAPLLSGYISRQNYEKVKGSSIVGVTALGRGRIIGFTENLAFRAFWFGTNRLLLNAIFYGSMIHEGATQQ